MSVGRIYQKGLLSTWVMTYNGDMPNVTEILQRVESGDGSSVEQLLPLVYDQLRAMARARIAGERIDHTLQGTALVHEVYLRLVNARDGQPWNSRNQFFAAAAEAMRRILIDSARARKSLKRGGKRRRIQLQDFTDSRVDCPDLMLDLDDGLTRLAAEDPVATELVKLRLFAGLSVAEAGEIQGMSRTTAYDNWEFARAWFAHFSDTRGN